ncbi:Ig-like domain-containing protein [Paraliomyxa miuraensis]|uniref:Ig-like domain-containing protein n=1 Tax=Paraliomyxa miuraensis TaxID=376150 RepID=UPI00224C99B4|nr:Ig-like domain-containing protein [Paraliomyxa miuraensis]MCX4242625.1 Ig-like domain-containing protein [Paraliomyxa miuraensis]
MPVDRPLSRPSRRRAQPGLLVAILAVTPSAWAEEPTAERPETWDMSVEELQQLGLGQYRGSPIPVPAQAPHERVPGQAPEQASQGRIFVNFDGANLSSGWDDSTNDVTQINELAGNFAAYGAGAKRDAVMQAVAADWAPFDVIVTDTRPGSGNYTMNMTGPTNPFGGGVLGIAPLDCDDSQTHNNITYAFHSVNDSFSAAVTATTIGQEVAHSYGLEHVDAPSDIMNPYNAGGDASFTDQCITIVQGVACGSQHAAECGSSGLQNSYQELLTLFGPSSPDVSSPVVQITYPSNGATFPTGSDFTITVDASDDQAIDQVTLYSNGNAQSSDGSEPYGWDVSNIPAGTYELYVIAADVAGNETQSAIVTISVGDDLPPSGGDTGPGTGGTGGDTGLDDGGVDPVTGSASADDGGGDGTDEGSLPPGYGLDDGFDPPSSCACRTAPGDSRSAFGLILLVVMGAQRRRSSGR